MTSWDFLFENDFPLQGMRVGISGAIPEQQYWEEPGLDRGILEFVRLFSGQVFKLGGHVVHGSHPAFTPVIVKQAERLCEEHPEDRPLTLIVSGLWVAGKEREFEESVEHVSNVIFTPKLGPGSDPQAPETRRLSLTALRLSLAEESDALVAVGGKIHADSGFSPGVLQELAIARQHRLPVFVIAGLGGFAGQLEEEVVARLCDENQIDSELGELLAKTKDVTSTVGIVIQHLIRLREEAVRRMFASGVSRSVAEKFPTVGGYRQFEEKSVESSADWFDSVLKAVQDSQMGEFSKLLSARR